MRAGHFVRFFLFAQCFVNLTILKFFLTRSLLLTLLMKKFQQLSRESNIPADLTSERKAETMFSTSASGKRSGISPDDKKSLIKTRKRSSTTWASLTKKRLPIFFTPARKYRPPISFYRKYKGTLFKYLNRIMIG